MDFFLLFHFFSFDPAVLLADDFFFQVCPIGITRIRLFFYL